MCSNGRRGNPLWLPQMTCTQKQGQPQGIASTVGDLIGAYKSIVTNAYIRGVKHQNWRRFSGTLWQRNFWEHIIRYEHEYEHEHIAPTVRQ
jgi:hypothetical protein